MLALPQVQLDTTLADLYALGNPERQSRRIAIVLCAASSEVAPTSHLAQNSKFLYQDSTFSTTPESVSYEKYHEIQRATAIKYLSLVPQHDAFAAGNMPVILFNLDTKGEEQKSKEEAERTISSLLSSQRPRLLFFPGPKQMSLEENEIDSLMAKMELDELEGYPVAMSLDTHYFLNSKAALATSGLPTYVGLFHSLDHVAYKRLAFGLGTIY